MGPKFELFNNISLVVKVWVWELCLNGREACSLPQLTLSIGPNEALIRGVGCCSAGKHTVSKATMKMTTKTGGAVAEISVSLNCMLSKHFKSTVTEYSPNFNGEQMKEALKAFVCRFSFFFLFSPQERLTRHFTTSPP